MQKNLTGQQFGNYRLVQLIGRGGFAEVYLGQHVYLNTQAAIKILHTRIDEQNQEGFLKEARTIAGLVHPNIIRVLEFGLEGQTPYLVMDYAAAGTLRQRYPHSSQGSKQMPLAECVQNVKQVASALQYAHERRIIHRDIKPENMLIGQRGEVLLSDFGIATVNQSSRYQDRPGGDISGTIAYMAPEQLQGKPTLASDQYALAIVVYEWLSGDIPFHGSFAEIGSQHLFTPPPSLQSKVPGLPVAVEQVIMTALAKDPGQRFPSVQAFADALEQAVYTQTFIPTYRQQPGSGVLNPMFPTGNTTTQPGAMPPVGQIPVSNPTLPPITATIRAGQPSSEYPRYTHPQTPPTTIPNAFIPPYAPTPPKRSSSRSTLVIVVLVILLVIASTTIGALLVSKNNSTTANNNPAGAKQSSVGGSTSTAGSRAQQSTPSPTPVKAGTVLYHADWSKDAASWIGSSEWKAFQNGQVGSDGTGQSSFSFWAPVPLPTSNYSVEARIQFVRASFPSGGGGSTFSVNNYEFGIMVRGDSNADGYEAGITYLDDSGLLGGLYGHPNGALIDLIQADNNRPGDAFTNGITQPQQVLASGNYQPNSNWHTYRVDVAGNSIKLYLDGALLVNTTDNTYITGTRVGLRAVYATINVQDFKVTAL